MIDKFRFARMSPSQMACAGAMACTVLTPAMLSARTVLPTDAQVTCGVDQTIFDGWFDSGSAEARGHVMPANGFNFPPWEANTSCDFYRWGAQMFLWLISPDAAGGGRSHKVLPLGQGKIV